MERVLFDNQAHGVSIFLNQICQISFILLLLSILTVPQFTRLLLHENRGPEVSSTFSIASGSLVDWQALLSSAKQPPELSTSVDSLLLFEYVRQEGIISGLLIVCVLVQYFKQRNEYARSVAARQSGVEQHSIQVIFPKRE